MLSPLGDQADVDIRLIAACAGGENLSGLSLFGPDRALTGGLVSGQYVP
ncbi:hypothetical protein [Undibacterium sp. RuTC16W]